MIINQYYTDLKCIYIKKTYMLVFYIRKVYRVAISNLCSIDL